MTEALGLCSGTLRQPHLPLCFPKPIPKALSQQVPSYPRLDVAQLGFLFPFSSQDTLMALGMYCPSLCLLLSLGSSLLYGWRGSDACASSRPSLEACTVWENWGCPGCPFPFHVLESLDSEARQPGRSLALPLLTSFPVCKMGLQIAPTSEAMCTRKYPNSQSSRCCLKQKVDWHFCLH